MDKDDYRYKILKGIPSDDLKKVSVNIDDNKY